MGRGPHRVVLAIAVAAALGAAGDARAATLVSVTGLPVTADGARLQTGRLARDGVASACNALKLAPGDPLQTGQSFNYRVHTFPGVMNEPACITATFATACTGANAIFSAAYIPEFVPAAPRTNYAADLGASPPTRTVYSFNAPARSRFAIAVHEVQPGAGCAGYDLTVTSQGPFAQTRPALSGDPAVGRTLTASNGTWAGNPPTEGRWRRCARDGTDCADIPGATATSYTITEADLGRSVRYRASATEAGRSNSADSAAVDPYLPFAASTQSLDAGDRVQRGFPVRTGVESRCGDPTPAPAILQPASLFLYDAVTVTSLLNEETCLVARTAPATCLSGVTATIYGAAFDATSPAANLRGSSGAGTATPNTTGWLLGAGASGEVVATATAANTGCAAYEMTLGADAPFATARPAIAGAPAVGQPLTASDGTWSGTPALARQWLRCTPDCVPIPGATGPVHVPSEAGGRIGLRVTAAQGRTVSSDAEPTAPVAAPPPGAPRTPGSTPPPARDARAPKVRITLARTSLAAVRKRGSLPVVLTCDEACRIAASATVTRRLGRRLGGTRIAAATTSLRANRRTTVRVALTRKARRGLRKRRELTFTLRLTAADAANNRGSATRRVRIGQARRR